MTTASQHYQNTEERTAFYLLKDLMETAMICENEAEAFYASKLDRLRNEMYELLQSSPGIGREFLHEVWEACFFIAREQAEKEHLIRTTSSEISWQQVFDTEYSEL